MSPPAAQRHRMNRVVNFAQAKMSDALDLATLADVACLSKFHFTRVFRRYLGQTPLEFLSRLRLERSARYLLYARESSITDVALDCGFSSSQVFSRAFRQRFHTSPRCFRSREDWPIGRFPGTRIPAAIGNAFRDAIDGLDRAPFAVRIEDRPEYRVAYIRHFGSYFHGNGGISATFAALGHWARLQGLWHDSAAMIGLCPDNAALTPADYCLYDACIPVPRGWREDDVVSLQTIPAGTYAVLPVACSSDVLYSAWEWLTTVWLLTSGAHYDLLSSYEWFPAANGAPGRPETGAELCMRIKVR